MPPSFSIRPATPADCPALAQVQITSYQTAYANFFPPTYFAHFTEAEQTQDWLDWLKAQKPSDFLLVAVTPEQRAVGYVLATAQPNIYQHYASEVDAMHVLPAFQRQGIGGQLLRAATRALQASGCPSTMLWTIKGNPIRRWYEQLNGRLLGEKTKTIEDWAVTEVAYGWDDIAVLTRE